ncbi:hypothetical protein HMPREF9554_01631 [Treponema phagedenis F0421]|nr:hypothetical protein HMPREF9554_01631 [Treponema phagedenis F0421]
MHLRVNSIASFNFKKFYKSAHCFLYFMEGFLQSVMALRIAVLPFGKITKRFYCKIFP